MDPNLDAVKSLIESTTSNYFWWFFAAALALYLKNLVESLVYGLTFLMGKDYSVDDIVYIQGTRKARIVRQTMNKTVFHLCDTNRRLVVPNRSLYDLHIETALPNDQKENNV